VCAVRRHGFPGGANPARRLSLQPVAKRSTPRRHPTSPTGPKSLAPPAINSTKSSAAMEPTLEKSAPPSTLTKVREALFRLNSAEELIPNGRQPWHAGVKEGLTSGRQGSSSYRKDFVTFCCRRSVQNFAVGFGDGDHSSRLQSSSGWQQPPASHDDQQR